MTKKAKIIILVAIIILLGVGAYYYYQGGFVSAEEKIMEAEEKFRNLDSYTMETEINVNFIGGDDQTPNTDFHFIGDVDRKNKAFQGEGEVNFKMQGTAAKVGGSFTYIDDNLYGSVDTFPYLALPLGSKEVSMITENDILIKEGLLKDINVYLASYLVEKGKEPITVEEIFKETKKHSKDIWKEGVITVEKTENDMLEGKKAKKYVLNFDGEKMVDFYIEFLEDYEVLDLTPGIAKEQKEEIKKQMKEEMKSGEDIEVYVWIQGGYIGRMKMVSRTAFEMDENNFSEGQDVEIPEEVEVISNIYYRNFNKNFEIDAPEEYITLEDLMTELKIPIQLPEIPEEVESN